MKERSKEEIGTVFAYAMLMIRMRARACAISQLTGLKSLEVRTLWREKMGESSPSGQQPNDIAWYVKTPQRRAHAALLYRLYAQCSPHFPRYAAYAHAYYHYARMTAPLAEYRTWSESGDPAFRSNERDYVIPFSRGLFLCQILREDGKPSDLTIKRCRRCQGLYTALSTEAGNVCPTCLRASD